MQYAKGEKSEPMKNMKAGGKESVGEELKEAAPAKKMKAGGKASCMKTGGAVKKAAPAKKMKDGGSCYKTGGFVKAADGCATKGKTKGRFV